MSHPFRCACGSLLRDKPPNPVQYLVDYLRESYPDQVAAPGAGFDGPTEAAYATPTPHYDEEEEESEDDEDDYVDELPHVTKTAMVTRRRTAVSAEAGVDAAQLLKTVAEKAKTPKTPEEAARIRDMLARCLLFQHLHPDQLELVAQAADPAEFKEGDLIIKQGDAGDLFYVVDQGVAEVGVGGRRMMGHAIPFASLSLSHAHAHTRLRSTSTRSWRRAWPSGEARTRCRSCPIWPRTTTLATSGRRC